MKSRPARKRPREIWEARKAERDERSRLKRRFLVEAEEFIRIRLIQMPNLEPCVIEFKLEDDER